MSCGAPALVSRVRRLRVLALTLTFASIVLVNLGLTVALGLTCAWLGVAWFLGKYEVGCGSRCTTRSRFILAIEVTIDLSITATETLTLLTRMACILLLDLVSAPFFH